MKEPEEPGGAPRDINHPVSLHRPAIVHTHDHTLLIMQIDHSHQSAEWQAFVRRGQFVVIEGFAAGGAPALKRHVVEGCQPGLFSFRRLRVLLRRL